MPQRERIDVLHVDDDRAFLDVAGEFLEREDERFAVSTATDPRAVLDRLAGADADPGVDCVVSDYGMPGMDGLELLRRVRESYPELPFVLFTGKGSEEIASRAISAGVTDYLQKGTGTEQYAVLANRIANAVEADRARREAARAERRVRNVHERITDAFVALDADWRYTYVNDVAERLLDRSAEDLRGRTIWEAFPQIEDGPLAEALRSAMATQETTSLVEYFPSLGRTLDVKAYPAADGLSVYFRSVDGDADPAFFEELVNAAGVGVGVYDRDGRFTYVNDACADLVGTDAGEIVGRPVWEFHPDLDADRFDEYWASFDDGETRASETRLRRADGSTVPVEVVTTCRLLQGTRYHFGTVRDVSDRKAEERALRRYATLVEAMDEAVFMFDADGTCTFVNDAVVDHVPHSRADLVGTSPSELGDLGMVPDDATLADYLESLDEVLAGERDHVEYTLELAVGGEPIIADVHISAVTGDDGEVLGAVAVSRDVTERRHRERELAARTRAMEAATDGIAILDGNQEYVYVNQAHVDVYGYDDADAFLGQSWRRCYGDAEVERLTAEALPELEAEGSWRGEAVGRRADGSTFPQELSLTALDDGRTICVVRDVTDRKAAQRRLRRERKLLAALFDAVPHPVVHLAFEDDEAYVRKVNEAFEDVFGRPAGEVQGESLDALVVPDRFRDEAREINRTARDGGVQRREVTRLAADGEREFLLSSVRLSGTASEEGVATYVDITDRKRRERRLERQNERLDRFTSIVGHDLHSPLNVAAGRLELVREDCDSEHLATVADALDRMESIVEGTLTLARQGRTVAGCEVVDLAVLVPECWRLVGTADADLSVVDPVRVRGDRERLRHVFENLLGNAIEHGGDGVAVRVGALDDGFYVEDDGPGIPGDRRGEVFEPGHTTTANGTGLGLAIVREVAEAHGWTVRATAGEEGGARFEFTGVELA